MSLEIKQKWLQFKYMNFLEIINKKKMTLISIGLLIYVATNLFYGKRGLISYFEKKDIYKKLQKDQNELSDKIASIEHKNSILTENIDLDFIEILIREKFLFGKEGEITYIVKDNGTKN